MQNGFSNLEQWAKSTGYEIKNNKFYGIAFDKMIFDLPKYTDITDPHSLKTNPMLRSVCNNILWNKGLNIKTMFGIDPGKKDFFGNPAPNGNSEPGVCEMT